MTVRNRFGRRAAGLGLALLVSATAAVVLPDAADAAPAHRHGHHSVPAHQHLSRTAVAHRPDSSKATIARAAQPAPNTPSAGGLLPPLRLKVPGLLDVRVTLPSVGGLLGGRTAAAAPASTTAAPTSAPRPAPSTAAPAPRRTAAPRTAPSRVVERSRRVTVGGGGGLRQQRVDLAPRITKAPTTASPTSPTPALPARPEAVEFERMLRQGTPVWLLAGVIAALALATALVVRAGGHRTEARHGMR